MKNSNTDTRQHFFNTLHEIWNRKLFVQGFLVAYIFSKFLSIGVVYAEVLMSPEHFGVIIFIINIPLYLVEIIGKYCCSLSFNGAENEVPFLRLCSSIILAWFTFYIVALIFKFDIKTYKLVLGSVIVGMLSLIFIGLVVSPLA